MALSEFQKLAVAKVLDALYERRVPVAVRDRLRLTYRFHGNTVVLSEERPAFQKPGATTTSAVARFAFDPACAEWSLFCADRNQKWHPYTQLKPSRNFSQLVEEVDADPTGIFWG